MDNSEVYPDVLGEAFSFSSQRLAQLGSLVTAGATVVARREAQANDAKAVRSQQALGVLRDQERAARQLARTGWAPAHDSKWLARADLLQALRTWSAATAYADADPAAASAVRKCEERLRGLHPYAMARYDRLRSEGTETFDAMTRVVPLFARAPHARPGDAAAERRSLAPPAGLDIASRNGDADENGRWEAGTGSGLDQRVEERGLQIVRQLQDHALAERGYALSPDELETILGATTTLPGDVIAGLARADSEDRVTEDAERARAEDLGGGAADPSLADSVVYREHLDATGQEEPMAATADAHTFSDRTAAQLAAESFPCTAADSVRAAAVGTQAGRSATRTITIPSITRSGRSG